MHRYDVLVLVIYIYIKVFVKNSWAKSERTDKDKDKPCVHTYLRPPPTPPTPPHPHPNGETGPSDTPPSGEGAPQVCVRDNCAPPSRGEMPPVATALSAPGVVPVLSVPYHPIFSGLNLLLGHGVIRVGVSM